MSQLSSIKKKYEISLDLHVYHIDFYDTRLA